MTTIAFTRRLAEVEATQFNDAVWFDGQAATGRSSLVIMRWLADPAVRAAIVAACPPGTLPLQTRQRHRPARELISERDYRVSVNLQELSRQVMLRYCVSIGDETVSEGQIEFLCVSGGNL